MTQVVQRLQRESRLQGRVPDHDRDPLAACGVAGRLQVARSRQADADAHAGSGMSAVEDIVLALRPAREASDTIQLAQGVEALGATGQQLVRVGLVAGVPHDPVAWRVHHPMQRQRQLHRTERAGQVAARLADRPDHLGAQLIRELCHLARRHPAQLGGITDRVENRHSASLILAARKYRRLLRTSPNEAPFRHVTVFSRGTPGASLSTPSALDRPGATMVSQAP